MSSTEQHGNLTSRETQDNPTKQKMRDTINMSGKPKGHGSKTRTVVRPIIQSLCRMFLADF